MNWIVLYFQKHRERKAWGFFWRICLENVLLSALLIIVFSLFINGGIVEESSSSEDVLGISEIVMMLFTVPIIETLLFQAFPVYIARILGASFKGQVLASLLLFCILHMSGNGVINGLIAGVIGGFYLAFTYAHWRSISRWSAFWMTLFIHMFHNLIVFLPILIIDYLN